MKLNLKKTNLMLFRRSRKYDFQPIIHLENKQIDLVEESNILGVIISSYLKWEKNVNYIIKKFMKKLWMLRRIKQLGGTVEELLCVYEIQLRCITELACPAWNGALTKKDENRLEKLQKISLKIILGEKFSSYNQVLNTFNLQTLKNRKKSICTNFAIKTSKFPKFNSWFPKNRIKIRNTKQYKEVYARTSTYQKSPLLYLANLLNNQ